MSPMRNPIVPGVSLDADQLRQVRAMFGADAGNARWLFSREFVFSRSGKLQRSLLSDPRPIDRKSLAAGKDE